MAGLWHEEWTMRLSLQFPQLAKADLFEDMPSSDIAAFLDSCELRSVSTGTVLLEQDHHVDGMLMIAYGCVEVTMSTPDGHVAVLHHAREAETLGCMEAATRQPCVAWCTAVGDVSFLFCPLDRFAGHLAHPLIQRNVMRIMRARMLRDSLRKHVDQHYSLDRRVCAYLLRLTDRSNRVPHSQGYIAKLASCSRQSINRTLAVLRGDGLIAIEKGKIRLLDRAGLERKLAGQ